MTLRHLLIATVALLAVGCAGESAQDTSATANSTLPSVATTVWSPETEFFFERPLMVADQESDPWAIHVTQLDGFRPLTDGTLTLRFRRPDGAAYVHTAHAPSRPGIFTPQPTIPETGTFRLLMIVDSPQVHDTLDVGDLTVYANADAAPTPEPAEAEISFLKEQQWATDFGVAAADRRSIPTSIEAPGEIVPMAGHRATVAAPVSGLVPARANLDMPVPGDRVREGQPLAVLAPSGDDGSYAAMKGRVERLKREVARAERLVNAEAIPQKRLVEARHDLEIAQAALESTTGSGGPEGTSPTASSAMKESGGEGIFTYHLRAPIRGRVHERHLAPGSRVDVGTVLYTIIDLRRVWVRLRVPAEHAAAASEASGGVFTVEGSDHVHDASRVVSTGAVLDPATRTVPVTLEALNPNGRLKIGMMANARLFLDETRAGIAIPNAAIQTEDGEPVAYVQTGGESFERRPLRLGPTDGKYTVVERGVEAGEHVVTAGAYQVYLASLGDTQIGGHGHPH